MTEQQEATTLDISTAATQHPAYNIWKGMRRRCYSVIAKDYKYYGGRGITVYDEWRNNFWAFANYMGERPPKYTLDRIDVNGNYEPGNVQWSSMHEQCANKRNNNDHVGVYFSSSKRKWSARLMVNRKLYVSSDFDNEPDAIKSRRKMERMYM